MPLYRLTHQAWLDAEVLRLSELLPHILDHHAEYSPQEVLTKLADLGLHYSNPEWLDLGLQLLAEGIIEEI